MFWGGGRVPKKTVSFDFVCSPNKRNFFFLLFVNFSTSIDFKSEILIEMLTLNIILRGIRNMCQQDKLVAFIFSSCPKVIKNIAASLLTNKLLNIIAEGIRTTKIKQNYFHLIWLPNRSFKL